MIFFHRFDDQKEIETLKFYFEVADQTSIQLNILDGCFEHAPIIIRDPKGQVRGLYTLKTRIKSHFIGSTWEQTTNGGIAGKILPGVWTLEVLKPSFRVTDRIQLEIRLDRSISDREAAFPVLDQDFTAQLPGTNKDWLSAELHCHSYYSDGRVSLADVLQAARSKDLDALALMDHSVITTKCPQTSQLIIPGTEVTMDNEVHYNIYGIRGMIDYMKYFEEGQAKNHCLNEMFSDLHEKGYLLSVNHPFADGMTLQHDFDLRNFNFLEVINAPYSTEDFIDNKKAIRFFDFLWQQGHYLFGIGGSDAHKKNYHDKYPIALPLNKIHAEEKSIAGILKSMKAGRVMVENDFNAQVVIEDETGRELLPGTEVAGTIYYKAQGDREVHWHLVKNGQCVFETFGVQCDFTTELSEGDYVRLDAFEGDTPLLFVDPLFYHLAEKRKLNSFQQLLAEFEG